MGVFGAYLIQLNARLFARLVLSGGVSGWDNISIIMPVRLSRHVVFRLQTFPALSTKKIAHPLFSVVESLKVRDFFCQAIPGE